MSTSIKEGVPDMTLTYTLTEEDYLNFNRYYLDSAKDFKKIVLTTRIIGIFGIVFAFLLLLRQILEQPLYIVVPAAIGLILLAMVIFAKKLTMAMTLRRIRKILRAQNPKGFGEVTLTFDGKTVRTDSKKGTTEVPVKEIESVVDKYDTIFLYIGAASAFIIPHRAFESDAQREGFLEKLHI